MVMKRNVEKCGKQIGFAMGPCSLVLNIGNVLEIPSMLEKFPYQKYSRLIKMFSAL